MSDDLRSLILLSVQRALLGEVTPEMRAVTVAWNAQQVQLKVFVDGEVSDAAYEAFDAGAVAQIVADFPEPECGDPGIECEFVRLDEPDAVPGEGTFVFLRAGTHISPA